MEDLSENINESITETITKTAAVYFGIRTLKPYQILVTQRIMEQEKSFRVRNQIVILPTGTGKSVCFLIPAVLCKGITVIVYPLLALMNDQMSKLEKAGIDFVCVRGGQTREERAALLRKLDTGTKIVITTPESLNHYSVIRNLKSRKISLFAVDEAHVISQWGKSFRPAYTALTETVLKLKPHQILAFTATASAKTIKDIRSCLFFSKPLVVRGDADRTNIIYSSFPALNRTQGLIDLVKKCEKPAIVFCNTRPDTKALCIILQAEISGTEFRYYNAGLSHEERLAIENWFLKSEDGVLLATSAYGMGIDKPDIRTVIHHRLPQNIEEYLQESGRAGRDGEISHAHVIVTFDDMEAPKGYSPLVGIFTGNTCRRRALLGAIGQEKDECSGCDVCLNTVIRETDADRAIQSLVKNWPFRFDSTMASYLLCGSRNIHLCGNRISFNPVYKSLATWNPKRLSRTINHLAEKKTPYPVSFVQFCAKGNLLYPSDNFIYNITAKILRRINHGYIWIIRKARRLRISGKKIFGTRKKTPELIRTESSGGILDRGKNGTGRKPYRP